MLCACVFYIVLHGGASNHDGKAEDKAPNAWHAGDCNGVPQGSIAAVVSFVYGVMKLRSPIRA